MKTISRYIMTLALLITAVTGAWAQTETLLTTITPTAKTTYSETTAGVVTVTPSDQTGYNSTYGWIWKGSGSVTVEAKEGYTITKCVFKQNDKTPVTITTSPFAITFDGDGYCVQNDEMNGVTSIEVYGYSNAPSGPDVTINDTKTEASFQMPQYDVTATYTIKRDMSVDVAGEMADRIRIKKDGNDYQAVDATQMDPVVIDNLETNSPVTLTVTTDYTLQLQKQSETDETVWTDVTALSVGTFRYKITGAGNYSGICYSEEFALFQGYEVTVGAGEYATFYKDENLYTEDEDAELYTIASVTDTEAVLSSAIEVAPAETPLLVYNKSEQDKTFLLIPTTDKTPDNVTAATQFVGTLEATTIPASATGADNYALNGYAFVWVKTAIEVGANKCWLHIASQHAAARAMTRSIVGGNGTTGIDAIENVTIDNEGWYDLQGRKLQAKPNRGGIYIHNGKKVVVRK